MSAVTRAVRAHSAFLPVARELERARMLPASSRYVFWRAYRGARHAMRPPYRPLELGQFLAGLVQDGFGYDSVTLGLRLARAATLAQLRSRGAAGRVHRALASEAYHLARLEFRAALGLCDKPVNPELLFGVPASADWVGFSDGSHKRDRAAVGVLLRQPDGEGEAEIALTLTKVQALQAELAAATVALRTLLMLGARNIHLNVDSLGVLRAFEQRLPLKYCLEEADIAQLVSQFSSVRVTLVPRLDNYVADRLAAGD